jgi:hypothetical protein
MASRTSKFYKDNPEARAKRLKYQKKYNKQSMQIQKRVELNKINRDAGTYGNGDGKDVSHKKDGSTVMEAQSKNRARNRDKK